MYTYICSLIYTVDVRFCTEAIFVCIRHERIVSKEIYYYKQIYKST